MLKTLRENIRHLHWILWVVIITFIALAFAGLGGANRGGNANVAATVGGVDISEQDLGRAYRNLEQRYKQMFGDQWSPELADQLGVGRQALEQLINRQVLIEEAKRLGIEVSDAEVRKYVLDMPTFKGSDGSFIGAERYAQFLRSVGYTPETFEAAVREDLLSQKINQVLAQNLYLSDSEVEAAYRKQVEKARIRYIQMPQARFASEATASEKELTDYLAAHPQEFQLPEQRDADYLLVDQNLLLDQVDIPDSELHAYYDDHPDEFQQQERVRARHILLRTGERSEEEAKQQLAAVRKRIEGGEDFATVAREVSEDPASARNGGDLGFFARGQMVPAFEEAAFGAKVGELVGPVVTPFGVHLIQVTDRQPAGEQPFDEVKDQIRSTLAKDRVEELARQRAAALAEQVKAAAQDARVETMRNLAQSDPAVFFYEPAPFGRNDPVAGLGRSPAFAEAAFDLAKGSVSDPVQVPRGWAVIYSRDLLPPRSPKLSEVEPKVRRAVETAKRKALAMQRLTAAKQELDGGKSLDDVASELGLQVTESEPFGAGVSVPGLGAVPEVVKAALSMPEGAVGGPVETPQGAVLYQVSERTEFDPKSFKAAEEETRKQLVGQRVGLLLTALVQQRRQELGVTYSRDVVERYKLGGGAKGEDSES